MLLDNSKCTDIRKPFKTNRWVSHMHARAYLRASTVEQDAERARKEVEAFAAERGLPIVGTYIENEFGAKLARPELFRLLADGSRGISCWSSKSIGCRA